ncbi:MAG: hypothetical protein ABIH21_00725 [Patescibacteria group bacterium]
MRGYIVDDDGRRYEVWTAEDVPEVLKSAVKAGAEPGDSQTLQEEVVARKDFAASFSDLVAAIRDVRFDNDVNMAGFEFKICTECEHTLVQHGGICYGEHRDGVNASVHSVFGTVIHGVERKYITAEQGVRLVQQAIGFDLALTNELAMERYEALPAEDRLKHERRTRDVMASVVPMIGLALASSLRDFLARDDDPDSDDLDDDPDDEESDPQ